jgi:hypothetical protein
MVQRRIRKWLIVATLLAVAGAARAQSPGGVGLGTPVPVAPPPPPPPGVNVLPPEPAVVPVPADPWAIPPLPDWCQGLSADYWYVSRSNLSDSPSKLTMQQLGLAYEWRFPVESLLFTFRPQFSVWVLGGPTPPGPDLPPQLYALSANLGLQYQFTPRLGIAASITPGLYTDFTNTTSQMFRIPAEVVGTFAYRPDLTLVGGVLYTAQPDFGFLPVVGAIWRPAPDWRFELIYPRPRVVYHAGPNLDVYGQFAFFNGVFAVRSNGINDILQYRDWRLAVGAEWAAAARLRVFFEFGGAFFRELELHRQGEVDIDPGFYFRAGGKF